MMFLKLIPLFYFLNLVFQFHTVSFVSKTDGEIISGFIKVKHVDNSLSYIFPNSESKYNLNSSDIKFSDSVFFHTNLQKFYIEHSLLARQSIFLDVSNKLDEVKIQQEKTFYDGVKGARGHIASNSPVSGRGYVQKLGKQKDYFISSIEIKMVNRSILYGRRVKSYGSGFKLLVGKLDSLSGETEPDIIFEANITVNTKKNGWLNIDLDDKIDLSCIDYLFLAVKGNGDFYSIGVKNTKRYPDITALNYIYLSNNRWKRLENFSLPMIRYKLSNKAN